MMFHQRNKQLILLVLLWWLSIKDVMS